MYVHHCVQRSYTTQQGTVLINFVLILQTIITAQMTSTIYRGQRTQTMNNVCPSNIWRWRITISNPVLCYQQHCTQRNAPEFKLLRSRFWGLSPCRGDTSHRWGWNLAWRREPRQISPPSVQR